MKTLDKNKLEEMAILSIALLTASNSCISGVLVFMQKDLAISRQMAEFLITLSSIATIIAIALSEKITKKIGMKKCVQIGLLLVFVSGLLPVIRKTYISIFLSRIILGTGIGLFNGHSANYISALYSGEKASSLHGKRNSMEFIGQIVLLILSALLIKIKWQFAFLVYLLAFFILIFFTKFVEDPVEEKDDGRFIINRQVIFYILFAGVMIMNLTGLIVRFPTIATMAKGMDINTNLYMTIIPIFGMASGFAFGFINRKLRGRTILMALIIYVFSNMMIGFLGENMYV